MRSWSIPMGRLMGVEFACISFSPSCWVFLAVHGDERHGCDSRHLAVAAAAGIVGDPGAGPRHCLRLLRVGSPQRAVASHWRFALVRDAGVRRAGLRRKRADGPGHGRSDHKFCCCFDFAGLHLGVSPSVSVWVKPWVSADHLLRSAFWLNIFLAGRQSASCLSAGRGQTGPRRFFALSRCAAGNPRRIRSRPSDRFMPYSSPECFCRVHGCCWQAFSFLWARNWKTRGLVFQSVVDTVRMRDIMLTDFACLSASDTLEDAVYKSIHNLQDDFPVVRGGLLVGVVSRQRILETLQIDGNGYIQSIMSRGFQVAQPEDSLGVTFRRISAGRGLSLVPVVDGERIVGIVTLQNLMHSMGLLAESRRLQHQSS